MYINWQKTQTLNLKLYKIKTMNKFALFIIFIIAFSLKSRSQDIDVFQKKKNDNFKFENINPQINIDEYRILSRNLRMKEMMYAMVMPGYIHFYANENAYGYSILALRAAAYGELAYMSFTDRIDFSLINTKITFKEEDVPKTDIYMTYGAIGVILGTYFYDWIHGQYILKKKQENIRYKYNMKMNLSLISNPYGKPSPGMSLNIQF